VNIFREIIGHAKKRREYRKNSSKYVNNSLNKFNVVSTGEGKEISSIKKIILVIATLLATTLLGSTLLFFVKGYWVILLITGILVILLCSLAFIGRYKNGKVLLSLSLTASCLVFGIGAFNQNKINNKPVLINTTQDRSYKLANQLLTDLLTLEDNQKLLGVSKSQGRGISSLYIQAAKQSEDISKKWNPLVNGNPPLPGFIEVFTKINKAADLQSQELTIYYNLLQQSDAKSEQQLVLMENEYSELVYSNSGAIVKLVSTVKPLGIKLEVGHGA
jgi:hypothetical protein